MLVVDPYYWWTAELDEAEMKAGERAWRVQRVWAQSSEPVEAVEMSAIPGDFRERGAWREFVLELVLVVGPSGCDQA